MCRRRHQRKGVRISHQSRRRALIDLYANRFNLLNLLSTDNFVLGTADDGPIFSRFVVSGSQEQPMFTVRTHLMTYAGL